MNSLRHSIHSTFTAVLLLLFAYQTCVADDKEEFLQVMITAPFLNIHTGPGRGYPIFHVVEKGERIYLEKQRTSWIRISTEREVRGWVNREQLFAVRATDGAELDFTLPGWSDYLSHRWYLGFQAGDFGGAETIGVTAGFRATQNISAELKFSQATGNFSDSTMAYLAVKHQPFPQWRLSPYFLLGAGQITTSPNTRLVQSEDRSDGSLLVGVGANWYLTRRFMMSVEYNNHLALTSRNENEEIEEWKAGFSAFF